MRCWWIVLAFNKWWHRFLAIKTTPIDVATKVNELRSLRLRVRLSMQTSMCNPGTGIMRIRGLMANWRWKSRLENGFRTKVGMSIVMHEVSPRRPWIPDESRLGGLWLCMLPPLIKTMILVAAKLGWGWRWMNGWLDWREADYCTEQYAFFFGFMRSHCANNTKVVSPLSYQKVGKKVEKKRLKERGLFVCFFYGTHRKRLTHLASFSIK